MEDKFKVGDYVKVIISYSRVKVGIEGQIIKIISEKSHTPVGIKFKKEDFNEGHDVHRILGNATNGYFLPFENIQHAIPILKPEKLKELEDSISSLDELI